MFNCNIQAFNEAIRRGDPRVPHRGQVDIVMGGPPCQNFSANNVGRSVAHALTRARTTACAHTLILRWYRSDESRGNFLVADFLETVKLLQPAYVLMENVANMVCLRVCMCVCMCDRALLPRRV